MSQAQAETLESIKKRIIDNKWSPYISIYQTALPGKNNVRTLAIFYLDGVEHFVLLRFVEIDGDIENEAIETVIIGTKRQCLERLAEEIRIESNGMD